MILDTPGVPGAEHVRVAAMCCMVWRHTALSTSASLAVALALEKGQASDCVHASSVRSVVAKGA